ncbi:hypothetical protein E4U16_007670 [Claviceps sp. LM84 group G4]|nr:hypothetical protein E4U16_007670 [Claviceps sp. LM84 group G4]
MKFSSVLGTFALSTLEAYRAYASPLELEATSPVARALESVADECCVRVLKQLPAPAPLDGLLIND